MNEDHTWKIIIDFMNFSGFLLLLSSKQVFVEWYFQNFLNSKKHVDKYGWLDNWIIEAKHGRRVKFNFWHINKTPLALFLLFMGSLLELLMNF